MRRSCGIALVNDKRRNSRPDGDKLDAGWDIRFLNRGEDVDRKVRAFGYHRQRQATVESFVNQSEPGNYPIVIRRRTFVRQ
jgi:hypothetical protein